MSEFEGLDLQAVEDQMDGSGDTDGGNRVVLGVLDGTTDDEEWITTVDSGAVLILNIEGDLHKLADGFARPIKEHGGELMHFRDFLIITPDGVDIDTSRL
jgi:SepF-like predicted cell division protein (DUF552 family)